MGGYGVMPDLFQAQLRAIDARNRAVSSIGQSRAGIQYGKEKEQQQDNQHIKPLLSKRKALYSSTITLLEEVPPLKKRTKKRRKKKIKKKL